jgi:hypothetical protein
MDNASAQIEELRQEVALLRDQMARADARLLTCLVRSEAKILACQTDLAMLKDFTKRETAKCQTDVAALEVVAKDEIVTMWKRVRALDCAVAEIQEFIGPVVEKIFPKLLKSYVAVGEKFKASGTYSEVKRD